MTAAASTKIWSKSYELDPDLAEILALSHANTQVYAKTLHAEQFTAPWSILHHQMFNAIDSGHKKIAIAAPRGIGKTTLARCLAQKSVLFRDVQFICYISKSATFAEMQTENIKRELLSNREVRDLFGSIKISENPEIDEQFSKAAWTAYGSTLVLPRGAGQQVRGLNWNNARPQLIIVDDLEDKKEVRNIANRQFLKDWFFSDVMKSVNMYLNDWRIVYIDTIKHEDSLLANLISSDDWLTLNLSLVDENFESLVPEYMTTAEILIEKENHQKAGMLDTFYMEYCNLPISTEDAVFKPDYINYYKETDPEFLERLRNDKIETIILCDPAKTVKIHSAESAIVGVGIDAEAGRYYVRDIDAGKFYPDEFYDKIFNMAGRLNCKVVGLEVTSLNEFITQPFKNEMFKRGHFVTLLELSAVGKKEERIAALAPLYRQGYVFHNSNCCSDLEAQLFSFPRSARFDIMDSLAYLVKMLEAGSRYFQVPEHIDSPLLEFEEVGISKRMEEYDWRVL